MNAINQKHVKGFIDKANKEQKVEILAFLMNFLNKKIEDSPTDDYQLTGIKPNKPVFPWTSKVNKDNTLTITTYKCKDLDITIPASIKGKRVTTVGYKNMRKSIFHEFPDITSVLISEGILRIENAVFYFCTKLKHITLPNSLNYIGDYAFASCVSLTSIIIPEGVETINDYTYKNCESLTSVNIPKTVGKIGHRAFDGCINLSSITFPEGVHTMEYGVFQDCHKLTDVFLPASLTTINPTNFTKLEKIMVHAPKASYAIEFAKRKGLKVVEV